VDLPLIAESSFAAATPWELARLGGQAIALHPDVRYLYRTSPDADRLTTVELQRILRRLGLPTGKADGGFGPDTKASLRTFQRRERLVDSGVPDRTTWDTLRRALRERGPNRPPRVLIVRPDADRSMPFENGRPMDAETVYQSFGVRTTSLVNPSAEALLDYANRMASSTELINVIHP